MNDFTFDFNEEIFKKALDNGYKVITLKEFFLDEYNQKDKILVNRIDVDVKIEISGSVKIGNNVYIGPNATIGLGAIVRNDVKEKSIIVPFESFEKRAYSKALKKIRD